MKWTLVFEERLEGQLGRMVGLCTLKESGGEARGH